MLSLYVMNSINMSMGIEALHSNCEIFRSQNKECRCECWC